LKNNITTILRPQKFVIAGIKSVDSIKLAADELEMGKFDEGREHKRCTEKCARMHIFLVML
jgi:hypothetical protein